MAKAEETLKYVLGVEPMDSEALANLDRIYVSLEAWAELAEILEMRVKAVHEPHELVDLWARLGEVYEARLGNVESAIRAFRAIFVELDKTHEGAIQALARIYESLGAWVELNTVYERELENAAGDVAEADIRAKLASLASERLNDPQRAIDTWKIVLDLRGEDPEALGALSALYEAGAAWRELTEILERQIDTAPSDDDRVNILTRRARVFKDKKQRDDLALEDWNRVLDIDYANLAALRSIAAIRRRQQDATELVSALHNTIDRASNMLDEEELKDLFRELGKTYGERLEQPYDAAEAWKKLLDIGPDFEAMNALETIYRTEERWPDVIDVKMQRAAALEDPAQKIEELGQVAALWTDNVQEPDSATVAFQKILEIDAKHDEAFLALERLHTAANRWEPLIELYLARLETRDAIAEKTELLRKIARVFEEKLDDKNQALDALINALGEDFHDRDTSKYLERMAQATGRWGEVIQTANNWLQEQNEPHQKIRLCLHLAKWYGDDLGRPDYAQPYYAQIVKLDPNNVGALRQMGQLYRKGADWQNLHATLRRALDVAVADSDRKEILNELGELLDAQMNQTDQAIGYFTRALEVDGQYVPSLERPGAHLRGTRSEQRARRHPAPQGAGPHRGQRDRDDEASHRVPLRDEPRRSVAFEPGVPRGARARRIEPASAPGSRARVRDARAVGGPRPDHLEVELEAVTTWSASASDVLVHLARLHEEHFLKAEPSRRSGSSKCSKSIRTTKRRTSRSRRNYRKLRLWQELHQHILSATSRRRSSARRRSISTGSSRRSTARKSRTSIAPSTRTRTSSTSTRTTSPRSRRCRSCTTSSRTRPSPSSTCRASRN